MANKASSTYQGYEYVHLIVVETGKGEYANLLFSNTDYFRIKVFEETFGKNESIKISDLKVGDYVEITSSQSVVEDNKRINTNIKKLNAPEENN